MWGFVPADHHLSVLSHTARHPLYHTPCITSDEPADVQVLQQEPLHGQLVAALLKHGCTAAATALLDVGLVTPATGNPNTNPSSSTTTTTTMSAQGFSQTYNGGSGSTYGITCGYCDASTHDPTSNDGMDTDEEEEDDDDDEEEDEGEEGHTSKNRSLVSAAQRHYPAEWDRLCKLHTQAHNTLAQCTPGEERASADKLLSEQLLKVRTELLHKAKLAHSQHQRDLDNHTNGTHSDSSSVRESKRKRQLPAAALATLKAWLYEHRDNPYPTEAEKRALAKAANLDLTQVRNWYEYVCVFFPPI